MVAILVMLLHTPASLHIATSNAGHLPPARAIEVNDGQRVAGRVLVVVRCGSGRSRVGRQDAPSLITERVKEILRRLLGREEQPVLHCLMIRDDPHPVMFGAPGLLDHESPAQPGPRLNDLTPVVGRPARRLAAEPEINLLERPLRDLFESVLALLFLHPGVRAPGAPSLNLHRPFCERSA